MTTSRACCPAEFLTSRKTDAPIDNIIQGGGIILHSVAKSNYGGFEMKKILITLMAAMMLFAFVACDDGGNDVKTDDPWVNEDVDVLFADDFSTDTQEYYCPENWLDTGKKEAHASFVKSFKVEGGEAVISHESAYLGFEDVDFSKYSSYTLSYTVRLANDFTSDASNLICFDAGETTSWAGAPVTFFVKDNAVAVAGGTQSTKGEAVDGVTAKDGKYTVVTTYAKNDDKVSIVTKINDVAVKTGETASNVNVTGLYWDIYSVTDASETTPIAYLDNMKMVRTPIAE